MDIDAVVFDLGGVITGVTRDVFTRFSTGTGIPLEALGPIFADGYDGLAEMELGRIGFGAYIEQVCSRLSATHGTPVDSALLLECVHDSLHPVDEMIDLVGEIRGNHKVAILTNNNPELREVWEPRMPPDFVDVMVDSSQIGVRKPDREAYEHTVDLLGTTLDRSVFVDDTPANVDAAARYGMRTVLFADPGQCRRELVEHGVRLG